MVVVEERTGLGAVAGGLAVGEPGIIVVEVIPVGGGAAGITRGADDREALHPPARRNDRNAALINHGDSPHLIGLVGGAFIELSHRGVGGIDVLLDHHVSQTGPRGIKDVAVVPHHRHAMQAAFEKPDLQGKVGGLHGKGNGVVVHDQESPAAILDALLTAIHHEVEFLGSVSPTNGRART